MITKSKHRKCAAEAVEDIGVHAVLAGKSVTDR